MKNKKLYLAAPLFSDAEKKYNVYLRDVLSEFYDIYLPQEDGLLVVDLIKKGISPLEASKIVFENDIIAINNCDILLIVLDGRTVDEGAAFELGVAFEQGKKCVALQTDPRRLLEIGNNPMISMAVSECFSSIEELLCWVKEENQNGGDQNAYCVNIMRFEKERQRIRG